MKTIAENLQILKDSTDAIKLAIIDKGGDISGNISTWADVISNILSGGVTLLGGINNKLNGEHINIPSGAIDQDVLYTYNITNPNFEKYPKLKIFIFPYIGCMENTLLHDYHYKFLTININNIKITELYNAFGVNSGYSTSNTPYIIYNNSGINAKGFELRYCVLNCDGDSYLASYIQTVYVGLLGSSSHDEWDLLDVDYFTFERQEYSCLREDTEIVLGNLSKKKVLNINYNDDLLVWDFDKGNISISKPFWIKKELVADYYYHCEFNDNSFIDLIGSNGKCHRVFNCDTNTFEYATDCIGNRIYTLEGIKILTSCKKVQEKCKFYNIITNYHMNLFANNILTSCRYNNLYPIQDMKFIKNDDILDSSKLRDFQIAGLSNIKWYKSLRLEENNSISIEDTIKYINNCESLKKSVDDFEENQEIVESVEEANVGWIDPEGNIYGYKLYMPGQMSHNKLADKICKKLGYKEQDLGDYSKTLEDLGWSKFTNDYLLTTAELTDKQKDTLTKFMSTNPKVKKRDSIKLGNVSSEFTKIENVKNMSKKDLTNKMRRHNKKS